MSSAAPRIPTSGPPVIARSIPSIHYGARVRLESVDNAFEQGTSAALNMLGLATVHDKVPWFWSDQFDLKMVIVGLAAGARRAGACVAIPRAARSASVISGPAS